MQLLYRLPAPSLRVAKHSIVGGSCTVSALSVNFGSGRRQLHGILDKCLGHIFNCSYSISVAHSMLARRNQRNMNRLSHKLPSRLVRVTQFSFPFFLCRQVQPSGLLQVKRGKRQPCVASVASKYTSRRQKAILSEEPLPFVCCGRPFKKHAGITVQPGPAAPKLCVLGRRSRAANGSVNWSTLTGLYIVQDPLQRPTHPNPCEPYKFARFNSHYECGQGWRIHVRPSQAVWPRSRPGRAAGENGA